MANAGTRNRGKYSQQRPKVPVPVVSIGTYRKGLGLTLQAVCDHMREEHGMNVDRGTISGIENGHRGASAKMLAAYADALGIPAAVIDTQYEPRRRGESSAA